ncbi:InlB B-repeat-containing protein [Ruminococcus bicirculans (ex Wegman et al. 2014)]|uniref:InlB B-repeat-containing protein n=1 Tax=Ruminococcus bicirculans (ex Wegman et al. 2014) TaxID=1160721 RepID=UPI003A914161
MTKTNKRRRVASVLLALVMLLSLMPSLELPAHAFWDDYDDGFDCPNCDHYHFGSEYMCDCLFCTIDCNYECWVETHCNDCGVCFGDTPYWCETCYKCADCMEDTHCSTCGKCYIGEDDQLCGECHKGSCCSITICDTCGFCDDCANDDSDPMHCSLCNACFGSVDECVDDDDTGVIHCIDCHTACEQCEECLLNQESCEDCGLCLECCEGNSDCSEGMCAMDTDYADHFCEDCGLCFHDSDPCEDGCDQRCKDCCRDAVSAMGCDHDDWCFSDSDFEDHLKTEHAGAGHTHIASATWAADGTQHWHPCRYCDDKKLNAANHEFDAKGVCKVCGYISGSSIVINRQPRGVKCKTSIYSSGDYDEEPENDLLYSEHNWVTFSVSAKSLKGDELTYQWYQKNNANPTAAPYKLPEKDYYVDVNTPTLRLSVSAEACMDDYSYYCVIGRKGDPSDTMKTAEAKLTATHAYSHKQAGVRVPTEDSERTPKYNVTWVDKHGVTHDGVVGGDPKCDGHKLPCLFEAGYYEPHYMTTGSKERIFPHTFVLDISYDAVGGGRVDVLRCSVCDYIVPVKSHVHDYGWNWDCTGFGSIYEYTFNIGGSTKTVEQLILESGYAHPEKCKVPGCEEFIMVPHSWGRWNVVKNPDTEGDKGGMEAECSVCEYKETKEIDGDWTKDTALVTVKNGRATRMIVKPGDKIRLYPEERTGQKAIGWKVEYRREYNEYDIIPVTRNWNTNEAKTLFKLVTNGSALEWGCTIPEFSAMGAPGGGSFFFEPVYASCDHSGGTTLLNAKEQVCDRKGYTGDTACADCGGTVKGETGDFRHSGPLELRDVRTATCTERGYSGNQYCTSCDRIAHKGVSTPSLHEIADNCKLINEVKPGCTTSGYSGDQQCTAGCGQIIRYGHVVNKLSHDWDGGKPAKQGKSEGILYTCQRADCGETRFVRSPAATEFTVTVIKGTASVAAGTPITDKIAQNTVVTVTADAPEAGKVFDKWVVLEGNVTLADATKATTTFTMPGNDVKLEATYKDAPPSHTHSYGTEWKYDDTDHWHECECGDKANIAAHSASEWIVDTAATETADGAKHKECTVCKKVLETAPIPATGSNHTHSYGTEWKYDGTNHWHECECGDKADTAAHNFQWEIDKAATKEATGIKHEECTVCGAKRGENTVIDKLPDGGNTSNTGSSGNNTNKPGNDDSTKCPQTGDSSNHIGWLAALCGVLTLLGVSGKKRKKSEVK